MAKIQSSSIQKIKSIDFVSNRKNRLITRLKYQIIILLMACVNVYAQKVYVRNHNHEDYLVSEGWMQNEKKENFWKFYYPNGKLKSEGHFTNNIKHEYWTHYAKSGNKISEGHMSVGLKTNWWIFYNDGKITHKCQFENDKKHGLCLNLHGGKIISASKFVNGTMIKTWTSLREFKKDNHLKGIK